MMRHLLRSVLLLLLAWPAWGQVTTRGTLSATGAVALDVAGMGTAAITVSGTYTGTIQFEVGGGPGTAAVTVDCATPAAPGTAVNSTTSTGVWVCPVAGLRTIYARMSAYTDGTAIVDITAAPGGGAGGGSGGGGSSFDGVLLDAAGGDAITDTANNALRVNIIAGAGSGGTAMTDDAAFTAATTNITPAGAMFDDVTPDSVNENDGGVLRMSGNRNLYTTIRDAGGNERGVSVTANNELLVELGAGTASIGVLGANSGVDIGDVTLTASDNDIGNVDLELAGTAVGQTNPVAVRLSDGASWLTPSADVTEDSAETAGGTGPMVLSVRRDTAASSAGTTGDNATFNTDANGMLWTRQLNPCTAVAPTTVPISVAADTAVITALASNRTYICGGGLVASAAEVVSIWEGTGTACGTGSAALLGSTTEANGMSFAANGGFTIPTVIRGLSTNVDICIRLNGTNRVAGWLSYVQAP